MKIILILTLTTLLISCTEKRDSSNKKSIEIGIKNAQKSLVNDQILPDVANFLTSTTNLETKTNHFCTTKNPANLSAAQDAFKDLSKKWYAIELFNFGPANDSLFSAKAWSINKFNLNYSEDTPTARAYIQANLTTTTGITFSDLELKKKGLHMLELLLFETADSTHSQDNALILTDYNNAGKCYLLQGITGIIKADAQYIDDGWNVDHKDIRGNSIGKPFKEIYLSAVVPDGSSSLIKLLKTIQVHLDYIKHRSVITKTGLIANISYQNAQANIDALEKLLNGSPGSDSFFSVMEINGSTHAVKANIATIKQAILDEDSATYNSTMGLLDGNFKRDIARALDVNLGLNFSDGD